MKNTKVSFRDKTHQSVDKIMDRADSISESSEEAFINMRQKVNTMRGNIDGYIAQNPEKSVLIAAGIGAAAGAILVALLMRKRD